MPIADDGGEDVLGRPAWAHPRVRLTRRRLLVFGAVGAGATALTRAFTTGAAGAIAGARGAITTARVAHGLGSSGVCAICGEVGHSMLGCPRRLRR